MCENACVFVICDLQCVRTLAFSQLRTFIYALEEIYALHAFFFISNTFISNARLKLAKTQANAMQHPEAELLLFRNYSHS